MSSFVSRGVKFLHAGLEFYRGLGILGMDGWVCLRLVEVVLGGAPALLLIIVQAVKQQMRSRLVVQ